MKKLLYSIILSLTLFSVTAQPPGQGYPCSYLPDGLECYTTAWFDTIDLQTHLNQFHVDTLVDTANVWQFGMSPKMTFDSAVGFVTDTVNTYPSNTKSILEYHMPNYGPYTILMFEHKYETDTLIDGGYVQVSCNNGQNWEYLGNNLDENFQTCSYAFASYNYPNEYSSFNSTIQDTIYAFTGNSDWTWSAVELWIPSVMQEVPTMKTDGLPDSLYFRFVFESDSIDSGKAGWMIRKIVNTYADGCFCGIEENSLEKQLFYPNPAKDHIVLNFDHSVDIQKVILYDIANNQTELTLTDNTIMTDNIPNGIYHIHFVTDKETYHSRLIIIH